MRSEKVSILNEVIDRVKDSDYCFILNYGSVKVEKLSAVRRALEKQSSRMTVVKNTLLKKAAEAAEWTTDISGMLTGPTAIITGKGDVAEVAKILVAFAKDNESSKVKGGNLENTLLTEQDITDLSKLPSKDAMRSMLLNTLSAPATSFVRVLNAPMLDLLYALKAYEDKKNNEPAA